MCNTKEKCIEDAILDGLYTRYLINLHTCSAYVIDCKCHTVGFLCIKFYVKKRGGFFTY